MKQLIILIFLTLTLSGCETIPTRSNFLYPDPVTMSTGAICTRLFNASLASEYRRSLWKEEINKRGVICTGGSSFYKVSSHSSGSTSSIEDKKRDLAESQKASNERGDTCIKYDKQYWYCENGYELEWNKKSCLYECFPENSNDSWYSDSADTKLDKPGGPPK